MAGGASAAPMTLGAPGKPAPEGQRWELSGNGGYVPVPSISHEAGDPLACFVSVPRAWPSLLMIQSSISFERPQYRSSIHAPSGDQVTGVGPP